MASSTLVDNMMKRFSFRVMCHMIIWRELVLMDYAVEGG